MARSLSNKQRKKNYIRFRLEVLTYCKTCESYFKSQCMQHGDARFKNQQSCHWYKAKKEK